MVEQFIQVEDDLEDELKVRKQLHTRSYKLEQTWTNMNKHRVKRSAVHARNRMPLHLPRSAVNHWGGEDGKHRLRLPEDFVLDDGVMLFHARVERHVVVLRPTTCDDQASLGFEW